MAESGTPRPTSVNGSGYGGQMAARRQLARMLREARLAAGITQKEAGHALGRGETTLYKIENGLPGVRVRPQLEIRLLCELYSITDPDVIASLNALAEATKVKGPFQPYRDVISGDFSIYLGLEGDAAEMLSYSNDLLPGLLQTEAYARILTGLPGRDGRARSDAEVDKRVQLRLKRQGVLTRSPDPLALDALVDESALRRLLGDSQTRTDQLRHLLAMSELPNVTVRVVPHTSIPHLGRSTGEFMILRFASGEPPYAYSDGYLGDNFFKEPEEIARYEEAFDDTSKHALDPQKSRVFIEQITKETSDDD